MGIPSFFIHIVKNHRNIIQTFVKNKQPVDNLFLDSNSIIYDAVRSANSTSVPIIIQKVIEKIELYISQIAPKGIIMIAFDGVAPVAKLEQQRTRRYKSWYQNEISNSILEKNTMDAFNTASITPGTLFFKELNAAMVAYFKDAKKYHAKQIIISTSDECCEGEHKIFAYLRDHQAEQRDKTHVVYGLDADLIMLSINHLPVCPSIYLFRETPEFIQSVDATLEPNNTYLLDIPELVKKLPLSNNSLYDYIFLCFFLGNDFLPHFPAINIRTGGIDKMMEAYNAVIGEKEFLTDGKTIHWNHVFKVVHYLAEREEEFFQKETKLRDKREKFRYPTETPQQKMTKFDAIPNYERDLEKYINPFQSKWRERYYKALFPESVDVHAVCVNYLEGLEWTMKYYTTGCPDWRWCYKYNYPPLLQDLIQYIPTHDNGHCEFVLYKEPRPVTSLVQLCYVLPTKSLHLLPEKLVQLLKTKKWHPVNCDFVWSYCKYFWECHPDLPEIDMDELENIIHQSLV